MSYSYVVSAQKPTVVSHAVVGCFTAPNELNLVLARVNRIELLNLTPEGLKPHREVPVYGRIASIKVFRAKDENIDSLLILTTKYHLAIICWNKMGEVRTRASGYIADRVGRPSETGIIACVHTSGLMAFRLYDGVIKVVQWTEGKDLRGFNVRCDELNIIDICFLSDKAQPTLAYIYQDQNGRHLKATTFSIEDKEICSSLWKHDNIEAEASMVIMVPEPCGGCLVVGQESISYHKGGPDTNAYCAIAPPLLHEAQINCYSPVDRSGQRFLLGDLLGRLFMLLLDIDATHSGEYIVKDLRLESLGEISIPECLVYLDNGVMFVGSRFGDSQLVKLTSEPRPDSSFLAVVDNYVNLAPIRDMIIMNNNGQQQIITCSGGFKDGTLRIIRNGIGIEELASVELQGIKNLFTLRIDSTLDNYLLIGFLEETHILKFEGEDLEDLSPEGFEMSEQTLWAGTLGNNAVIQITPTKFVMLTSGGVQIWTAPSRISVVAVNEISGQVIVACGNHLIYMVIEDDFKIMNEAHYDFEIAAVDINSINTESTESKICAISFWSDLSIALITLPELKEVVREKTVGEMLTRSMLLTVMEGITYLLVALGDGTLYYYQFDAKKGSLLEPKKATLGTQPIALKKFLSRGSWNIFACSDHPAVIYSSNRKLVFSNVNLKMVSQMTPLNSESYSNCLVLSDGKTVVIGKIDDIQKLHIRTIPLGESPSRIAHQPETGTIAVIVQRTEVVGSDSSKSIRRCASKSAASKTSTPNLPSNRANSHIDTEETDISSVLLLDPNTFEIFHAHELGYNEVAMSLLSCSLGDDPQPYYIVGTAIIQNDETEAKMGRILILRAHSGSEGGYMQVVHEKDIKGAAFSVQTILKKLVVAVNSCVRLFEWTADKELRLECSDFDNVSALYLRTKNDLILVGDLMRSISLLSYRPMESSFEKQARDYATNWMTACEIIDSESFLGAENAYNLFTVVKDTTATNREDGVRLQEAGMFYLGQLVNVFCHGSLIASHIDLAPPFSVPILYGTSDGGLGVIVQLPSPFYAFMKGIEERVAVATENCMRISHNQYRTFDTEKRAHHPVGFIDGDLIESILDMSRAKIESISKGLGLFEIDGKQQNMIAEDLMKIIDDLSRIH